MAIVTTKGVLWEHQATAIARIRHQELEETNPPSGHFGFGLFMAPGTGKTRVIIEQLADIYNRQQGFRRTLILCPPIVVKQWKSEIHKYSDIPKDRVVCLTGSGKKRNEDFMNAIGGSVKARNGHQIISRIFITNYEALLMPELFNSFMGWEPEAIVVDESHRIKNPTAKRTKLVSRLGKLATYKYILTGSPLLNSLEDYFSQIQFIKESAFPKNFFAFRHTYMWDANRNMPRHKYFPAWKPKPDAEKALGNVIAPFTFSVKKEECMDLPPFVKQRVEVEMSPSQAKAYEQMSKEFITFVKENSSPAVAELAITKTLRMRQILSGFVKQDNEDNFVFKDNPRLDALSDLIADIAPSEKLIIWCEFSKNYSMVAGLCLKLGFDYKLLTGEQSTKEKDDAVTAFRSNDNIRCLIANPGAGGIGVNLVEASHMIYFSRSPNLEHDIQSEARAYRGGSEIHAKVTRWDLVVPDTLDDVILKCLEDKQKLGEAIIAWASKRTKKENLLLE